MDRIRLMEVFVRVAELNGFTRAAEALGIPSSTVSTAIRRLEEHLRTRLIHRTTRRMHLTADGDSYLRWCRRILADVKSTEARFRRSAGRPSGKLRLDLPGRLARHVVIPELPLFLKRYPEIELEISATDEHLDLVEEGVDCAVRVGELPETSHTIIRLGALSLATCASRDYLDRYGEPKTAANLENHWIVGYSPGNHDYVESWEIRDGDSVRSIQMKARLSVNTTECYIAGCLAGIGIIQAPIYDVASYLKQGRLKRILVDETQGKMPISLIMPGDHPVAMRVEAAIEWLTDAIRRHTGMERL